MKNVLLEPCSDGCITKKRGRLSTMVSVSTQTLRILSLIGIFCVAVFAANAQQVTVRGSVKDATGATLPGVGVKIKDTNTATSTDAQGSFTISAPATSTLVFTFLGFATQEVAVNGKTTLDVTLSPSEQSLDEVVVTALGVTKERRGLVYSVQEVKGEEFTKARDNNIATALTGKIAGLDAAQINAGPGSSSKITIRGANIINGGNNQPLYVVDGLPIRNSSDGASQNTTGLNIDRGDGISMINPDDIETISVLKSGAAAALYGSQAANGVILITTKSGKAQKGVGVDLNSVGNMRTPTAFPVYQYVYGQGQGVGTNWVIPATVADAVASGRLSFGPKINPSISYIQVDGLMHPYEAHSVKDNMKNFYNNGTDITNTVSFSGGSQALTSRLSLTDLRSNALQPNSTYNRQGAVLNTSAKMGKNDFVSFQGGLNYTQVTGKNRPNVGYAEFSADWPVYLIANTVDIRSLAPGVTSTGSELAWNLAQEATNPYYLANYIVNSDKSQRFIANASIKMNILKNLFVQVQANRDFQLQDNYNYTPIGKNSAPLGAYSSSFGDNWNTNIYTTIGYNASFLKDFNVDATLGGTQARSKSIGSGYSGSSWIIPNLFSINNLGVGPTGGSRSEGKGGSNSAYGSAAFDYKKIVYLNVTGRNDWFSQLNRGSNSIFYPSIGTAVVLSDLIKMPSKIDMLKLRLNWAQVGSATVGAGQVRQSYSISATNIYGLPTLGVSNTLLNPTLRPLTVDTYEGGFEAQLLGSRLGLDITYYDKKTSNDILPLTFTAATGYGGGVGNAGSMQTRGIEAVISGTPIRGAITWNANINFTWQKSKVLELSPTITEVSNGNGIQGPRYVQRVGLPYNTVMAVNMKYTADGVPIFNKAMNLPDQIETNVGIGGYSPFAYSLNNDLRYKQFSMNLLFDSKFGAKIFMNQPQYATRFGLMESTLVGRETGLTVTGVDQTGAAYTMTQTPGANLYTYYNKANSYPGSFVYASDFIKIRRLTLSYSIPVNKLKFARLQGVQLSLVGSNLLTLYRDKRLKDIGLDPEMEESNSNLQGSAGVDAPVTRQFGFSLGLKF